MTTARISDQDGTPEHTVEWYTRETARQSRRTANAVTLIAWVVTIFAIATLIGIIVDAAIIDHALTATTQSTIP